MTVGSPAARLPKLLKRDDGGRYACQIGNYTPSVESWRDQNMNGFLRHWWQCASGKLTGIACNPLNGTMTVMGNNTKSIGLSMNVTYTVTNSSVYLNITDTNLPTAINSSLPATAQNGLTAALAGDYAPSVNNFVCDVHHDCKFPACSDLNWDRDDNWRAYQALISVGWVNDVFKQTYDALNEAQVRMLAQAPVIAQKFTSAGVPDDEQEWIVLESLNNALAGIAVLGLNFAPELAGFLYGAKMFKVAEESFLRAEATVEKSSIARARNILLASVLKSRRAALRQAKENIQRLEREAKDLENIIAKWDTVNVPTPMGTPQNRQNPIFSPIQVEGDIVVVQKIPGTLSPVPETKIVQPGNEIEEVQPVSPVLQPQHAEPASFSTQISTSGFHESLEDVKKEMILMKSVITAIRQSGRTDPTEDQIQTIMAAANPGSTTTNVISPTLNRRIIDFVGKSSGVLPSLTGSMAFALNKGTSTTTIDSLANFASITDLATSGIKTWLQDENENLLKGLHDSNGFYLWDWIQDARFIHPHTEAFDTFKNGIYSYFVAQMINMAFKMNRSFIYGFNRTIGGHTFSCQEVTELTLVNARRDYTSENYSKRISRVFFEGPWQSLFCDDTYPLFFHMYRIPTTDPLGVFKQRLASPTGLDSLGAKAFSVNDSSAMPYNISIQDIMNSSVQAYYAAQNQNTTDYDTIRQQRWLLDFKDNGAGMLTNTPSYEGVFNIPVCVSQSNNGAFMPYDWFHRPWPCLCGTTESGWNETEEFQDVYNSFLSSNDKYSESCQTQIRTPGGGTN